jgi:Cu/Ag efflux protein CusF
MRIFNRRIALLSAGLVILTVAGCAGHREEQAGGGAEAPADSVAASTQQTSGEVRTYTFHGTPKRIDRPTGTIVIDHERIGDYMEAMTMPYKVADTALLGKVTVGRAARFTLRVSGDDAVITGVDPVDAGQSH